MTLPDILLAVLLTAIAAAVVFYLLRAKQKGKTCIGCPYAGQCRSCSCQTNANEEEYTKK